VGFVTSEGLRSRMLVNANHWHCKWGQSHVLCLRKEIASTQLFGNR
jgi:hypothetical protein